MSTRTETCLITSRIGLAAILCCLVSLCFSWAEARTTGPQGAQLRAAPSDKAFVVTRLLPGTEVTVSGDSDGVWLGVVAPAGVQVWVYGDLVRNDAVIAPRMLVRAGPGIDYEGIGELKKGDRVRARRREGDWLQIEPPPGTTLWLKKHDLVSTSLAAPEPKPELPDRVSPPPRVESPVIESRSVQPPADVMQPTVNREAQPPRRPAVRPPIRRTTRPAAPERPEPKRSATDAVGPIETGRTVAVPTGASRGRDVVTIGRVKRAPIFPRERHSNFRLVRRNERGQTVTVCYLLGPDDRVEALINREVKVSGTEYIVPGSRFPALSLKAIELVP